jgi:8-oxo-dGTP pyrophosphatase MutT (NUDIX family)
MAQINRLILTIGYYFRNQDKEILLGLKKEGLFGGGKWNGAGGKVKIEKGETIYDGMVRETKEEASLEVIKAEKRGYIVFHFIEDPIVRHCHIYKILDCEGELTNSDEMVWKWFLVNDIPYHRMWKADAYWMPYLLENKKFIGTFFYRDYETLLGYENLKEVKSFDE